MLLVYPPSKPAPCRTAGAPFALGRDSNASPHGLHYLLPAAEIASWASQESSKTPPLHDEVGMTDDAATVSHREKGVHDEDRLQ